MVKHQDLEDKAAKLLEAARKLLPGPERYDALKEIGRLRAKLDDLARKRKQLQSGKSDPPSS